jgi:hypothetical protein
MFVSFYFIFLFFYFIFYFFYFFIFLFFYFFIFLFFYFFIFIFYFFIFYFFIFYFFIFYFLVLLIAMNSIESNLAHDRSRSQIGGTVAEIDKLGTGRTRNWEQFINLHWDDIEIIFIIFDLTTDIHIS